MTNGTFLVDVAATYGTEESVVFEIENQDRAEKVLSNLMHKMGNRHFIAQLRYRYADGRIVWVKLITTA